MRLIDADALARQITDLSLDTYAVRYGISVDALENAPTIDATPVIRCKDCRYWQDNNGGYPHEDCKWRADETPDADDWCSGAERKDYVPVF